jgi:hypothetical protein
MSGKAEHQRVAFSPAEFAALFGKSQPWGYRQIYSGKIKAITEYGRIQIPAAEVERILASAGVYNGLPKTAPRSKEEFQGLKPKLTGAWQAYVQSRRLEAELAPPQVLPKGEDKSGRAAALGRLRRIARQ